MRAAVSRISARQLLGSQGASVSIQPVPQCFSRIQTALRKQAVKFVKKEWI